jgi:putative CocE/NonD family hydrolase
VENKRYDVNTEENVAAVMRDGTALRADVYRPDAGGQFPVLLCRTPYNKQAPRWAKQAARLASHGYVVIVQDLRGRYSSDGEFLWEFDDKYLDAEDGYDTVEWAAALPYSNGRVGTYSLSHNALVQWQLATLRPPHLMAMAPAAVGPRLLDLNFGIFETGRRLMYCYSMAADCRRRDGVTTGPQTAEEANAIWHDMERGKWIWWLPLDELPAEEIFYGLADQYHRYLRHQNVEYWALDEQLDQINVPAFEITGWYDRLIGTIDFFTGMREHGMAEHARRNQKLLIGPWGHTDDLNRNVGLMDFGAEAQLDYCGELVRWFDYWLKGIDNGVMEEPPIKLFVMGENKWRFENEWPLARTVYTDYYFHSGGAANTVGGDGALSRVPPGDEEVDTYVYDPKDPVMSICSPDAQDLPYDQRPLDHRRDVLVYATEPLEEDLEVTGPVVVKLYAASTASDTDFTAKLIDVYPDGFAIYVCHGILRARYRESYEDPSLIEPGEVYEYTISLKATGNLFKEGHRIRVDISSSNFPFFDRNHNTGKDFWSDAELVSAKQRVYHNSEYPSRIILPVIPH